MTVQSHGPAVATRQVFMVSAGQRSNDRIRTTCHCLSIQSVNQNLSPSAPRTGLPVHTCAVAGPTFTSRTGSLLVSAKAWFGTLASAENLHGVYEQLKHGATRAGAAGMYGALAQLSGQQIRAIESGLRLSGHRNFTGSHGAGGQQSQPARFAINIVFSNGKTESIAMVDTPRPTIEGEWDDAVDALPDDTHDRD